MANKITYEELLEAVGFSALELAEVYRDKASVMLRNAAADAAEFGSESDPELTDRANEFIFQAGRLEEYDIFVNAPLYEDEEEEFLPLPAFDSDFTAEVKPSFDIPRVTNNFYCEDQKCPCSRPSAPVVSPPRR